MNLHSLSTIKRVFLTAALSALFSMGVFAADSDYLTTSDKAVDFLVSQMQADGSYAGTGDLAAYYKSPTTLYAAGRVEAANRLVNYIKANFLQPDGDVMTGPGNKSEDFAFTEYYHYTNAWIAMGCQRLSRFDTAVPTHRYLLDFYNKHQGGFNTHGPYHPSDKAGTETDTLSISHGGLMALFFGDLDKARAAGDLLLDCFAIQDELASGMYLRMDWKGRLVKEFPAEMGGFYFVSATEPFQAYFFVGYPIAYLGLLYRATGEECYRDGAEAYLNFAMGITGNIRSFFYAHKVAWGAAICAANSGNAAYAEFAREIADYLVSIQQPNGQFLPEMGAFGSLDQTAEIALWLRYVHAELVSSGN